MNDINENYFDVKEYYNFRAFLYSPAGDFLGEVELIRPKLSLRTTGFGVLDFELPEFYFNDSPVNDGDPTNDYGDIEFNEKIYSVLDGYEMEIWFGNLTYNDINKFKKMRMKIQNRPRSMEGEKTTYSYRALTNEVELSKVPIINWPGIEVDQYKQESAIFSSNTVVGDVSEPYLQSLTFANNPVENTEFIYRVHSDYDIEEPLRATNTNDPNLMGEEEYLLYEDAGTWKVWVWVPGNIAVPTDEFGTSVSWSDDAYSFNLYFETEVAAPDPSLELSPYYLKDGLGIEEILIDLFNNINPNFINWKLGTITEAAKEEVRSQLSFSNTNAYDMIASLVENYQIHIDFDTINREINVMKLEELGEDRGLRFEYGKYIKGIDQEFTTNNMINYIQGSDADGVGFADVSWTADNYIEDYSYYLSGVEWNGTQLIGNSNWLSSELATEIAKTNYYKALFEDEVWGSSSLIGIANIKKQLQEKINKKENELVELEADVELIEGVIEAYENAEEETQDTLNTKAVTAAYSVPLIIPAQTYEYDNLGTSIYIDGLSDYYYVESAVKYFTAGPVKSIKIDGVNFNDSFDFAPLVVVKFYNQGVLQTSQHFSNNIFGEVISLPHFVTADSFKVEMKVLTMSSSYQPIMAGNLSVEEVTIYVAEDEVLVKSWTNYLEYQEQELLDAKSRVANKNNEISKLKYGEGTLFNYDTTTSLDESLIDYNNGNYYGIFQIDKRIKYISNYTKIDFDSLSEVTQKELKKIRSGGIYQNSNISDSATLFKAAKEELLEKNYPEINLNIQTINILKTSEAYEDWHKALVGEKVFVYVPRIGVEIAAQIQELNIDFEAYTMSINVSTTKNYNKNLIKYLSKAYKTATKTKTDNDFSENDITNATVFVKNNEEKLENINSGDSSMSAGYSEDDSDLQVNQIELIPTYIDLQTDSLTHEKPVYYEGGAGKVKITDGGIYLKDQFNKTRIKIDSRKGVTANNGIKDTLRIDLEGNARFAGILEAGVDVSAIDNTTTFSNLYSAMTSYTDNIASNLEAQIDGAIATYFASGIPTPIEVEYEQSLTPTSPTAGEIWKDTSTGSYYIYIDSDWLQINEADMTSTPMNWPASPTLEDYQVYVGDLFYNNETGYGYRFQYDIDRGTPGVSEIGDYYWSRISDNAMVAALQAASEAQATADGKMTFFTATTSSEIDSILANATLQNGDVLILSSDVVHITSGITYKAETVYTYNSTSGRFEPENKADGEVAGWQINATDIAAKNGAMTLHSDSNNSGYNPYISIDQTVEGYAEPGIFLGIDGESGIDNGKNVFSMYNTAKDEYFDWTGDKLLIKSTNFELDNLGNAKFSGIIQADAIIQTGGENFNTAATLNFNNNISGGTRTILYNADGSTPTPTNSIAFSASPKIGDVAWDTHVVYSWSATGSMSGTYTGSTFTPVIENTLNTSTEVVLTVTYYATNDIDILYTKTEIIAINVTKQGADGTSGTDGADGDNGLRAISGTLYYQVTSTTPPSIDFAGVSYDISTSAFTGLSTSWKSTPPTFNALSASEYWYINWSGEEDSSNPGIVNTFSYTSAAQIINFDGVVIFSNSGGKITADNSNITSIDGGLLTTSRINSNNYTSDGVDFTNEGMYINFEEGIIKTENFSVDNTGLQLVGDLGGTIGAMNIGNVTITSAGISAVDGLGNPTFNLDSTNGDATFAGNVDAESGSIAGFSIQTNYLTNSYMNISPNDGYSIGNPNNGVYGYFLPNTLKIGASAIGLEDRYNGIDGTGGADPGSNLPSDTSSFGGSFLIKSWASKSAFLSSQDLDIFSKGPMSLYSGIDLGNNILDTTEFLLKTGGNIHTSSSRDTILEVGAAYSLKARRNGVTHIIDTSGDSTSDISTKIVKTNIKDLDSLKIDEFLDLVSIKSYYNNYLKTNEISLIIEDEEDKNNPFAKDLFFSKEVAVFDELPEYLKPHLGTDAVQQLENGTFKFSPKMIKNHVLNGVNLAATKYNHNRIKKLEQENTQLRKEIEEIKVLIGGMLNGNN